MSSAGVYSKEIDLSLYTETPSSTIFGVVHTFNKGPIGTPTLVKNTPSLVDLFGIPIDPSSDNTHAQGWFACREYLRRGNQLYVTRVESAATPAEYAAQSLPGGSDQSMATGADGSTSIPATRELESLGSTFLTSGVEAGIDILEVHDGTADDGFYLITNATETVLTVDRDWPAGSLATLDFTVWSSKAYSADTGATGVSSGRSLTLTGGKFSYVVSAGDILKIHDTGSTDDNGVYVISSVESDTEVLVDRDWPRGELTGLTFTIYTALVKGTAGSTSADETFQDLTLDFVKHDVQAGDILVINDLVDTGNNGTYHIDSVAANALTVNEVEWADGVLTGLSYEVWPGSITFQGLTKGTWIKGAKIRALRNASFPDNFNFEVKSSADITLETIYNVDRDNIESEMTASSAYFSATVRSNRTEPAVNKQMTVSGGDDGTTGLVDADFMGNALTETGIYSFKNSEKIQIDIIAVPGKSSQNIQDALITLAETRQDCIAIVDPPDWDTVDSVQDILDFHNGTLIRTTALNSSYAALYWTWQQVYDEYHDVDVWTAPSGHVAAVYANNDNVQAPWYAPAGLNRAKVIGSKDTRYSPDKDDRDALYGSGANVNPISNFVGEGIYIYGQKTLQRANTALNRVNVRRMLLSVEKSILTACRRLPFEPNDEVLQRQFKRLVDPALKNVLTKRGISEYLVVCDSSTTTPTEIEQYKMVGRIFIKPTLAAEQIEVQFVITSQSANFVELIQ